MTRLTYFLPLGLLMMSLVIFPARRAPADDGMWLFNHPPEDILREKYDFRPAKKWLDHLQHSAVRFNSGGSGSFISRDGLVMTNHHVGADALQKLSTPEHDYLNQGFHAKSREEEIKTPDLELNVLMDIDDVTDQVASAVKPGMSSAEAEKARRAAMNTIEKEARDGTGLRSDVVTLYQGGQYHLYQYKKYTDVRLVFAPEQSIAFFGGDPDNFEYPRYDLDICFFRAYEDDEPAKIEHYLRWSESGAKEDELIFVAGHPGSTHRQNTLSHLEFLRDRMFPRSLDLLRRHEVLLKTFSDRSSENALHAQDELFGVQNTRKAKLGELAGLQDPKLMAEKRTAEEALRKAVRENPKLADARGAWGDVDAALKIWDGIRTDDLLLERGAAFNCEQFDIARTLVRLAMETAKPNAERLREYRESNLESLKQQLFSPAPIYDDLETIKLADSLGLYVEMAGAKDELLIKVLDGKSPRERAAELVRGSKIKDVELRKSLADGGEDAVKNSDDLLIALALLVDGRAREVRKIQEEKVDELLRQAYAKISHARFALYGTDVYPDATFTLRLAFGVVKGYEEDGVAQPAWTTLGGAYEHSEKHQGKEPFALPASWLEHKDALDLDMPFNFVSTADIIGGNSGSPVVNRDGELVGIIFDGNIQSLVLDFQYTESQARALAVHSSAIVEALRKIYGAADLADEIQSGAK